MVEILVIQPPWKVSGGWVHADVEDLNLQKMILVFVANLAKQSLKHIF